MAASLGTPIAPTLIAQLLLQSLIRAGCRFTSPSIGITWNVPIDVWLSCEADF